MWAPETAREVAERIEQKILEALATNKSLSPFRTLDARDNDELLILWLDHTFDANTYQQTLQNGMVLHMDIDPQPGQIRLAVQDARTGLVGTIIAPAP